MDKKTSEDCSSTGPCPSGGPEHLLLRSAMAIKESKQNSGLKVDPLQILVISHNANFTNGTLIELQLKLAVVVRGDTSCEFGNRKKDAYIEKDVKYSEILWWIFLL